MLIKYESELRNMQFKENVTELQLELYCSPTVGILDDFINLEKLDLSDNEIKEILELKLDKLVNLRELYLDSNKINYVGKFDRLDNLQILYLSNNKLKYIDGLNKFVNLKILHLSDNKIRHIEELDDLVNLQKLNLNNNNITHLPIILLELKNLRIFKYFNNQVEIIQPDIQYWLDKRVIRKN